MKKEANFTELKKKLLLHLDSCVLFFNSTLLLAIHLSISDLTEQGDTIRKTIPYTLPWDDMPIDLSFIYEKEKPAGSMVS